MFVLELANNGKYSQAFLVRALYMGSGEWRGSPYLAGAREWLLVLFQTFPWPKVIIDLGYHWDAKKIFSHLWKEVLEIVDCFWLHLYRALVRSFSALASILDLPHVREGFTKKISCSFGSCPNYLDHPPSPQFGQLVPLFLDALPNSPMLLRLDWCDSGWWWLLLNSSLTWKLQQWWLKLGQDFEAAFSD